MELTIHAQEAKPLLDFTEIEARVSFQGATPTKKDVAAALAKSLKAKPELLIVRQVTTGYGEQAAVVRARLYGSRTSLELLERQSMIKKNTFDAKEGAAPEEAKPDATAEEKPAAALQDEAPKADDAPKKDMLEEEKEGKAPAEKKTEEKPAEKQDDAPEEKAKADNKPKDDASKDEKPKEGDA